MLGKMSVSKNCFSFFLFFFFSQKKTVSLKTLFQVKLNGYFLIEIALAQELFSSKSPILLF